MITCFLATISNHCRSRYTPTLAPVRDGQIDQTVNLILLKFQVN